MRHSTILRANSRNNCNILTLFFRTWLHPKATRKYQQPYFGLSDR